MGWFYNGGGQDLYNELTQKILGLNVQGFYVFAMPTQPLGWFKKELQGPDDFKGMKYRTVGLASNVMQAMGASVAQLPGPEILPAMEKGVIEAFEFNNPTSDMRFGGAGRRQVLLPWLLPPGVGSHRGCVQQDEMGQPGQGTAAESCSLAGQAANSFDIWKAWDIYSRDLQTLITKHGVHVKRTSEAIFKAQLVAWDKVVDRNQLGPEPGSPSSRRCSIARRNGASGSASTSINNEADYKSGLRALLTVTMKV